MTKPNILFICSDEHTRNALSCYGSSFIESPHLDRLAALGTRFSSAYTSSPLCVPARASLATGRYVHDTGCWDNAHPWHGVPRGWPHHLRDRGYHTVSIGKNHYRSTADDNGFDRELLPMHVRDGIGDLFGLLRAEAAPYPAGTRNPAHRGAGTTDEVVRGPAIMAEVAGAGETNHTQYDRAITAAACNWLREKRDAKAPWALYVSFVAPHFPLMAPREFYEIYPRDRIPQPRDYAPAQRPTHPVVQALARVWNFDDFFDDAKVVRARAGYYGLISFLDSNIGRILAALDASGERENTFIIYTSDHGEMLGNKGIWSTSALYEDSVGVPLIMAGPGVAPGTCIDAPVSHIDIFPTLLQVAGETSMPHGPGASLLRIDASHPWRAVMSEYHAGGSITGSFMLRWGRWKYHHYVGYPPELFDIQADPGESADLGRDAAHAETRARCEAALRKIVDPEAANARAFADQAATIERHGGVEAVRKRGAPGEHALDRQLV